MCWALYLASNKDLPEVPWDKTRPAFNTQPLTEEDVVTQQFSFPNVIYLGSHVGCGCGFMDEDEEDQEEAALRQKTVQSLSSYLQAALENGAQLEMFLCWEGDQGVTPVARKVVSAKDFENPLFPLEAKELANVVT